MTGQAVVGSFAVLLAKVERRVREDRVDGAVLEKGQNLHAILGEKRAVRRCMERRRRRFEEGCGVELFVRPFEDCLAHRHTVLIVIIAQGNLSSQPGIYVVLGFCYAAKRLAGPTRIAPAATKAKAPQTISQPEPRGGTNAPKAPRVILHLEPGTVREANPCRPSLGYSSNEGVGGC